MNTLLSLCQTTSEGKVRGMVEISNQLHWEGMWGSINNIPMVGIVWIVSGTTHATYMII